MESTIRPAAADDSAHLWRLQAELTEPAPQLLDAAIAAVSAADGVDPPLQAASTAKGFTLLVSVNERDRAVGYLLALTGETTHIAELAVDPTYRRAGRANTLLEVLIERANEPITVHVAVDNTAARTLYRTLGFQEQTRRDDQFEHTAGLTLRYRPAER